MSVSSAHRLSTLACILALSACHQPAAEPPVDKPRALIQRLQAAESAGRYDEIFRCYDPEERETLVFSRWFDAAVINDVYQAIDSAPEVVREYQQLVAKHGLDERLLKPTNNRQKLREVAATAFEGKQLEGAYADLTAFFREHTERRNEEFSSQLRMVTTDGDRATAQLDLSTVHLVRRNGDWYWVHEPSGGS